MSKKYPEVYGDFLLGKFADHVHTRRWRQGITTRQLAKEMGKSHAMISRWETRVSVPSIPDFLWLCYRFDLSPMKYFVEPQMMKTQTFTEIN